MFAGALQTSLVFVIIMLSLVVLTGYTGQISLIQMSLAGVAAFFMARMMADGSGQGTNLTAVSGPGLPVAARRAGRRHRGRHRRPAPRPAGGAHPRRAAGRRDDRRGDRASRTIYLDNDKLTGLVSGSPAQVDPPTFFGIDIGARSERAQNENPAFVIFEVVVRRRCSPS